MEQEFKRGALVIVTTTNDENCHSELGYVEDALIGKSTYNENMYPV